MIGGKRTRKKAVGENDSSFFKSSSGKILITAPMKAPRNTEKYEKYQNTSVCSRAKLFLGKHTNSQTLRNVMTFILQNEVNQKDAQNQNEKDKKYGQRTGVFLFCSSLKIIRIVNYLILNSNIKVL